VRIRATVLAADGKPLDGVAFEVVAPGDRAVASVGRGEVAGGVLDLDLDLGPVWGLVVDKQPILTFPVQVKGDTIDLGEIRLIEKGVAGHAFHAPDGRVFALPDVEQPANPAPSPAPSPDPSHQPPAEPLPRVGVKSGLSFSGLVASTAEQLTVVAAAKSPFQVSGASVRVRGVPTITADAIALDFPNPELAASGDGLSELSFTLKPQGHAAPTNPEPAGPSVPDLLGYSRELATRKLATVGLYCEVSSVVAKASDEGRVVRQIPASGTAVAAGSTVRLLVGTSGGA
jgi:hypothetical protein